MTYHQDIDLAQILGLTEAASGHANPLNAPVLMAEQLLLRPEVALSSSEEALTEALHPSFALHRIKAGIARYMAGSFLEDELEGQIADEGYHLAIVGGAREDHLAARGERLEDTLEAHGYDTFYTQPFVFEGTMIFSALASLAHDPEVRSPIGMVTLGFQLEHSEHQDDEPVCGKPVETFDLDIAVHQLVYDELTDPVSAPQILADAILMLVADYIGSINAHGKLTRSHAEINLCLTLPDEAFEADERILRIVASGLHDMQLGLARERLASNDTCVSIPNAFIEL